MNILVRHACPTIVAPMPSGDGLLVRLTPRAAMLRADEADAIDRLASRDGNGIVEITSHGNLQLRGLRPETVPRLADALGGLGLDRPHLEAAPLLARDPLSLALYDRLDASIADLPGRTAKFAIRAEAGVLPTRDVPADLRVWIERGAIVRLQAGPFEAAATFEQVRAVARALAPFRVRHLAADALASLLGSAGVEPAAAAATAPDPDPLAPSPSSSSGSSGDTDVLAVAPAYGAFGPGRLGGPGGLAWLARLAATHGDGALYLAPRSAILGGVADRPAAIAAARAAGLVVDPDDRRRRLVACAGAPLCAAALAPAREAAASLLGLVPRSGVLHVSGCAKGCAHPSAAAIVLVGAPGGYRIAHGSRADLAGPAA